MGRNELKQLLSDSLNTNVNLSMFARNIIASTVCDYNEFFNEQNVEIDVDNLCELISSVTLEEKDNLSSAMKYDSEKNCINFSKSINYNETQINHEFKKSILSIITNVYSIETDKHSQGVSFEMNNQKYGDIINDKLGERVIELVYGNEDDKLITLPNTLDELSYDFEEMIGSERLLTYFVNGRGDLFYSNVLSLCETEEECINLFDTLSMYDKTDENDVRMLRSIDAKYEFQMNNILDKRNINNLAI